MNVTQHLRASGNRGRTSLVTALFASLTALTLASFASAQNVIEEVAHRTPGFSGWQQEQWWTHCGDAAQFIGRAGRKELKAFGPQAIAAIQESAGMSDGPEWNEFLAALEKEGSPTAYMFRCSKCGQLGGYQDCD